MWDFERQHIGAPAKVRRGNKMLDTNDIFGSSRHDSDQIKYVFMRKEKSLGMAQLRRKWSRSLACKKTILASYVRSREAY